MVLKKTEFFPLKGIKRKFQPITPAVSGDFQSADFVQGVKCINRAYAPALK